MFCGQMSICELEVDDPIGEIGCLRVEWKGRLEIINCTIKFLCDVDALITRFCVLCIVFCRWYIAGYPVIKIQVEGPMWTVQFC